MNSNKTLLAIGKAIRYFREDRKWTQEYLGFKANLDRTYIGGAERGERNMTINTIITIAKALDINFYYLIKKAAEYE